MGKTKEEKEEEERKNIEIWKVKQLIKKLQSVKGNGTSMISLILPPKDQISRVSKMLGDEYGTASHIKSRVNRLSVLEAITSTQQRLKLYSKVPPKGLVIYCGTVITDDNKTKKLTIDFEPFRKINTSLYLCDNKFHVKPLLSLLETSDKYGFIVMDGNGCLYGTLCGDTREIIYSFSVDLPKKHGRGGQSAQRFGRIRMEKRQNYVTKVAEYATKFFIKNDKPNVSGIVLAGSADFKTVLSNSGTFDQRLQRIIVNIVDVAYGGESGFKQAIKLSEEVLSNVKFVREKKLIKKFMKEISLDTGKFVFGVRETMAALEAGALKVLIVWEELEVTKYEFKNPVTKESHTKYLTPKQELDSKYFHDKKNGVQYDYKTESLLDYLAENYRNHGCSLEFVSNKSQEGSQFCRGFGGIGGILRYQMDFSTDFEEQAENLDDNDDSDELDYDGDDLDGFM